MEAISKRKERIVSGQAIKFWGKGTAGVFIMQITTLVLIRKFLFKGHIPERM